MWHFGTGITGSCEMSDLDTGNKTLLTERQRTPLPTEMYLYPRHKYFILNSTQEQNNSIFLIQHGYNIKILILCISPKQRQQH